MEKWLEKKMAEFYFVGTKINLSIDALLNILNIQIYDQQRL